MSDITGSSGGVEEKEGKFVQSVERVINILEAMSQDGAPITVTDLAEKVGLKVSTVHRLLTTLAHRGYVEQNQDDSRYRLGFKVLELANAVLYLSDIRTISRPYLEELVHRCNETANLAILDNTEVVYVDQVESKNLIIVKMFAQVGHRGPIHCTASGKALMAFLPDEKIEEIIGQIDMEKYTNETITEPKDLKKELQRIRNEGHALDWGEREEHVRCVAAPVFNHESRPVASISVSGPSTRITTYYMKNELVDIVKDVAAKISAKMGYDSSGA